MITPKPFQQPYIENIHTLFLGAKSYYDRVETEADRSRAYAYNGAVLLKAPTGAGKTIMAGAAAEKLSLDDKVVWFWFAPFTGLVAQSARSLRDHHPGMRVRSLGNDRRVQGTKSGDTFVLTWASVVAKNADARKARVSGESQLGVDDFLAELRSAGFRIGVIIDEAHHGIGANTQSVQFYNETLRPDYSLMITATPDDRDAEKFTKAAGIVELHRVTVSREEAVSAGLVKPGVRSIAYISPPDQAALADFEAAALQDAVVMHERIKTELKNIGVQLTPLLLVQVSSAQNSPEETKADLIKLGIPEDAICIHTAKEPDENFQSMAFDESKEVLIFKMAAALGFDAPRASVMVSMRPVKDTDYGTQLVGRIMRVHRALQGKELPPILANGYLFLADSESQDGISAAAEKINKIRSELSTVSAFTLLTKVGGSTKVQVSRNGQADFGLSEGEVPESEGEAGEDEDKQPSFTSAGGSEGLLDFLDKIAATARDKNEGDGSLNPSSVGSDIYRYPLKMDAPLRFRTQELPLEIDDLLECIEQQVGFNDTTLLKALAKDVKIIRVEKGLFSGRINDESRSEIQARIDIEKAEMQAQQMLLRHQYVSARDLKLALLDRLGKEFRNNGMSEVAEDEDRLEAALALILVRFPNLLKQAEKECAAKFAFTRDTDTLPGEVTAPTPLNPSFKNIYGIFPSDLNSWEIAFAKHLDNDSSGTVLWWHRNPPRKKYSVSIVRPDGGRFFPDFIVGVKGRNKAKDGILLVETKHAIGSVDSQIKVIVEHKEYGAALMLHWENWHQEGARRLMTIRYNSAMDKNEIDAVFRPESMPTY